MTNEDGSRNTFNVEWEVNKQIKEAVGYEQEKLKDIENLQAQRGEGEFQYTKRKPKAGNLKRKVCDQIQGELQLPSLTPK